MVSRSLLGPIAAAHYPKSTGDFLAWFGSDVDCLDYLWALTRAASSSKACLRPSKKAWRRCSRAISAEPTGGSWSSMDLTRDETMRRRTRGMAARPSLTQRIHDAGAWRAAWRASSVGMRRSSIQRMSRVSPVSAKVDDGQVEHEVGEAASGLRIALDDVFQPFDDRRTAELDVTLHQRTTVAVNRGGPIDRKRWRLEPVGRRRGGVQSPGLEEGPVAGGRAGQADRGWFVVAVVTHVTVIEIELVMPRVADVARLPRARPQPDHGPARPIGPDDNGGRVDAGLEHQPRGLATGSLGVVMKW
jgi:hypothetical protein